LRIIPFPAGAIAAIPSADILGAYTIQEQLPRSGIFRCNAAAPTCIWCGSYMAHARPNKDLVVEDIKILQGNFAIIMREKTFYPSITACDQIIIM